MSLLDKVFRRKAAGEPAPPIAAPEAQPARQPPPAPPQPQLAALVAHAVAGGAKQYKRFPELPDSDPQWLAHIGAMVRARLDAEPSAIRVPALNVDMYRVPGFMSADECIRFAALVDADAKPSTRLGTRSDPNFRTSHTCRLSADHELVASVEQRIAALLGLPLSHSETVQGQRYTPGQQFKLHNDYFAGGQAYSETVAKEGGQRTWTAMVFLVAPEAGGCTSFPRAGVKVAPEPGLLVTWFNLDRQGRPNPYTHHEGMQVEAGAKYILTKWFREREWRTSAESDALRV